MPKTKKEKHEMVEVCFSLPPFLATYFFLEFSVIEVSQILNQVKSKTRCEVSYVSDGSLDSTAFVNCFVLAFP